MAPPGPTRSSRSRSASATPPRPSSAPTPSWPGIEPPAAAGPKSERPKRAPSSSAQETSRTVNGGRPSSASRRTTSTAPSTFRQPSNQPPCGTESIGPPSSRARADSPASVNHWFPASSISSSAPVPASFSRRNPRAASHVWVQATRCAPFSSPVSSRSCSRSATVRDGFSGTWAILKRDKKSDVTTSVTGARRAVSRAAVTVAVLLALWGLWELYRWTWIETGWTRPFPVNDTTLPHLHTIFGALGKHTSAGPLLITVLLHSAWFTAKEAMLGFAGGAIVGFFLAVALVHSRLMQRAFLPYIVGSQTIPILAVAPMVVVWLKAGWQSVAVIAAYLTFFPVTINTLRGLQSAEPRAHELLRSYAASPWQGLWRARGAASPPVPFRAFEGSPTPRGGGG